jgi:hypothetical protein
MAARMGIEGRTIDNSTTLRIVRRGSTLGTHGNFSTLGTLVAAGRAGVPSSEELQ